MYIGTARGYTAVYDVGLATTYEAKAVKKDL